KAPAASVKRVTQELGGKSPNIILDDADLAKAIPAGVAVLLHQHQPVLPGTDAHARPTIPAKQTAEKVSSAIRSTRRPPWPVSKAQFDKVRALIERGIQEGATLVCGGVGRPAGFTVANDTTYGLAGYVQGRDIDRVRNVAAKLRAGRIYLNGAPANR